MKMKLIKVVVVLAVFLGTYTLKNFTQLADNVYADGAGHEHEGIVIEEPSDETPAKKKPAEKDEEIRGHSVDHATHIATVTCGKDTPLSKLEELAEELKTIGVVKLIVKREGGKKASERSKKKKDEEDYLLSEADEDDYILADAWDEVLEMLRKNPMYAKDFDNPDLKESLEERIDDRIKRQVENFVEAYVEDTIKRLTKTRAVNLFDDEDEHDVYFEWDEQKEFIKDAKEKLEEQFNSLIDTAEERELTKEEKILQRRLYLQLHTLDKLKKAFNGAVRAAEEQIAAASGQGTEEDMFDPSMGFPGMPGMPGMDPFGMTQKPQNGWGLRLKSTPFGGVNFGIDRNGENGDWGIEGGYEHVPQKYLEMFGPMAGGGFGGGGFGGFNPYSNPMDFMGLGGR